jgi:hypothetical protein
MLNHKPERYAIKRFVGAGVSNDWKAGFVLEVGCIAAGYRGQLIIKEM